MNYVQRADAALVSSRVAKWKSEFLMPFPSVAKKTDRAGDKVDAAVEEALRKRLDDRIRSLQSGRRRGEARTLAEDCRADRRERIYRVGSAMFRPDHETSCRILDQSYAGMRLELHGDIESPEEFALSIPTLRFIGVVRRVWQNGAEIGVSILRWNDAS